MSDMEYGIIIITQANMSPSPKWSKTERGYEAFMVGFSFDNMNDAFRQLAEEYEIDKIHEGQLYCEVKEKPSND